MKLYEFLTGMLMFAIILGVVTLFSQPAQAGGNHHQRLHTNG